MPITDRDVMVALKATHSFSDVQEFMRRMYAERQFKPTQRDEMAKAALTGLLSGSDRGPYGDRKFIAECAYEYADAMLVARTPKPESAGPICTCLTNQLGPDYCEVHAA